MGAVGIGRERMGVITRAIDYSTLETMLVRADGAIEATTLPTQAKMMFPGPSTRRHLIAQLSEDVVIAGRRIPAETVVAYDTASSIPADRRLSVVYTPGEDEFLQSGLSGGIAGSANSVWMVVDRHGTKQVLEARFRNNRWRVNRQQSEAPGVSVTFASANASTEHLVIQRGGFLHPTRLDLVRRNASSEPLFAEAPAFDANAFTVELRTTSSADGTQIDYYLLRPKAPATPGATPTLMTGYGAFGVSFSPGYLDGWVGGRSLALWLERGGALAIPLIRGGGERGSAWHHAAMRERRQVSYDDFAAVAEALIAEGFTTREHLGVFGMSNGGLLAAVMGTQRPDLFGAVVSDVPLADMLRFPAMGMGAAWTNEYGDPSDAAMAEVLRRYSPYHNVTAGRDYPAFLITVATTDNRVGPGHARKLAARLIEAGARVYYFEDQEGGHGVSDPLSNPELMADRMTFLINTLMAPSAH
ncbi:MAG: prolyl oligopeptidase family serine peptidase [Hyphomonadaceae bacterium JAD_PAG50586_4]|nr:MAG: prolyl oligopeptidase family serine peptidase [Hyphomonadaceae bacterium JAD_PAG50586_4]